MQSTDLIQKEKKIFKILGENIGGLIFEKMKVDIPNLNLLSSRDFHNLVYIISNYIDTNPELNYQSIDKINLNEVKKKWIKFLKNYKKNYNTLNYEEKNKVILDYRIKNIGFYWVDLEKTFCIESMIRMNDCGRVSYGHTTIELREQFESKNESHMIVVYETITGNIKQVKGKNGEYPPKIYWEQFYNFLTQSNYKINKYVPTYKPENDLKIKDLPDNLKSTIYMKYPKLKNTII
jgi:hypothetical protein